MAIAFTPQVYSIRYFGYTFYQFDSFFKTRMVSEEIAERLSQAERPNELLKPFRGPYYRELKQLNVTPNGVSCILNFGNPPHIPVPAIEVLLPAMIELARLIEPHEPYQ